MCAEPSQHHIAGATCAMGGRGKRRPEVCRSGEGAVDVGDGVGGLAVDHPDVTVAQVTAPTETLLELCGARFETT